MTHRYIDDLQTTRNRDMVIATCLTLFVLDHHLSLRPSSLVGDVLHPTSSCLLYVVQVSTGPTIATRSPCLTKLQPTRGYSSTYTAVMAANVH